ncbi:hypothetical protein H5410_045871, partial [Solanum commersonii]
RPRVTYGRTIEKGADGGSIRSIKFPHNLLVIRLWVSSHPITLMKVKQSVDFWDSVQAPREDSVLLCNKSGHLLFLAGDWNRIIISWCRYWLRASGFIRRGSLFVVTGPCSMGRFGP